jgi:hypothetical protein
MHGITGTTKGQSRSEKQWGGGLGRTSSRRYSPTSLCERRMTWAERKSVSVGCRSSFERGQKLQDCSPSQRDSSAHSQRRDRTEGAPEGERERE